MRAATMVLAIVCGFFVLACAPDGGAPYNPTPLPVTESPS